MLTVTPPLPGPRTPPTDYERQGAQQPQVWEVGWMQRMLVGEQGNLGWGMRRRAGGVPQLSTVQRNGALRRVACTPVPF